MDIVTAREETLELLRFSEEGCAGSGLDFVLHVEEITQDLDPEVFEVDKYARQKMVCGGIGGRMSLSTRIRCGGDRRLSPRVASRCDARRRLSSRGCRKKFCTAGADSALRRMWLAWVHSRGRLRVRRRRPGWQLQGLCGRDRARLRWQRSSPERMVEQFVEHVVSQCGKEIVEMVQIRPPERVQHVQRRNAEQIVDVPAATSLERDR